MTKSVTGASANSLANMRLWQLISPSLPIGAYAYSQGLESAVEKGWVNNESEALEWISGILQFSLSTLDGPILLRFYQAWQTQNFQALEYWNQYLLASRESSELYLEDQQMGLALKRLLNELLGPENQQAIQDIQQLEQISAPSYSMLFTLAANHWKIPIADTIQGFLWSWCENQVAAGIKLIPLGQTAGQRILSKLLPIIEQSSHRALTISDDEIGALAPGFAIGCAHHEVQYSRLFRS